MKSKTTGGKGTRRMHEFFSGDDLQKHIKEGVAEYHEDRKVPTEVTSPSLETKAVVYTGKNGMEGNQTIIIRRER